MIASDSLPPEFNVATYFVDRNVTEGRGSRPAFLYEDRVLTYGDVQDLANRTGNALRGLGVGQDAGAGDDGAGLRVAHQQVTAVGIELIGIHAFFTAVDLRAELAGEDAIAKALRLEHLLGVARE